MTEPRRPDLAASGARQNIADIETIETPPLSASDLAKLSPEAQKLYLEKELAAQKARFDQERRLIDAEISQSRSGSIVGAVLVLLGVLLLLLGLTGNIGFKLQVGGLSASLSNATPGALIAVVGAAIMLYYRYDARLKRSARLNAHDEPDKSGK